MSGFSDPVQGGVAGTSTIDDDLDPSVLFESADGEDYIEIDTTDDASKVLILSTHTEADNESSGLVGIRAPTPTAPLHVIGAGGSGGSMPGSTLANDYSPTVFIENGTGNSKNRCLLLMHGTGGSGAQIDLYHDSSRAMNIAGYGSASVMGLARTMMVGTTGSYALQLKTNDTARMVIDANGKVGINDTEPNYKLVVQASATNEDLVSFNASDGNEALRFEVLGSSGATTWYSASGVNQHRLSARTGSNGMVLFNEQMHDCNFTMGSENSTKMLHVDASLDEVVIVDDNTAIGPEHLEAGNFTDHTDWDVAGDFSDSGGDATYTHSSGSGTLTQVQADLALALPGNRYYVFTYTVTAVTNDSSNPMAATITTGVAHEAVSLTVTAAGTYKTSFRAKASPADFVISATSTTGGNTFTLDTVSLKSCGGDLVLGERLVCADGGGSVRLGSANCGAATDTTGNTAVGNNALSNASHGSDNVAVGDDAMGASYTGASSVGIGVEAMSAGGTCTNSVGVGWRALKVATGNDSTGVGYQAGIGLTSGTGCTFIGKGATTTAATANGQTVIGADATCDAADTMVLGRDTVEAIRPGGDGVASLGTAAKGFKELHLKTTFASATTSTFDDLGIDLRKADDSVSFEVLSGGAVRATYDDTNGLYQSTATLILGCHTSDCAEHTLTADITAATLYMYPAVGTFQTRTLVLTQHASSSKTITWPAQAACYTGWGSGSLGNVDIVWAGGVKHTMSTGADAVDIIQLVLTHTSGGAEKIYASVIGQAFA